MAQLPFVVVPYPLTSIAASGSAAGRPPSHLGEFDHHGMIWQSGSGGSTWLRGEFSSSQDIDFISLLSTNATSGTTIRVRLGDNQSQVDGGTTPSYDSGALPFISPAITRDDGLYHSHLELPSIQNRRWWRIDIAGFSGAFQAAELIIGKKVTPSRYYSAGFEFGLEDLGEISENRWGVPDEIDGVLLRTLRFKLGWMGEAEFENQFRPLIEKLGKRRKALWCFDPSPAAWRQARTYFGRMKEIPSATNGIQPSKYEQEFSILSVI